MKSAMMRAFAWLTMLACFAASRCFAQKTDDASAQSKIVALERIWRLQAYGSKDLNTLDALLDPDFANVDQEGRLLSKSQLLARLCASRYVTYRVEAMDVRLHGSTAIVTAIYTSKRVVQGQSIVHHGRFIDTWLRRNGRWRVLASLSVPAD